MAAECTDISLGVHQSKKNVNFPISILPVHRRIFRFSSQLF